jgi:hypothetical protein
MTKGKAFWRCTYMGAVTVAFFCLCWYTSAFLVAMLSPAAGLALGWAFWVLFAAFCGQWPRWWRARLQADVDADLAALFDAWPDRYALGIIDDALVACGEPFSAMKPICFEPISGGNCAREKALEPIPAVRLPGVGFDWQAPGWERWPVSAKPGRGDS